MSSGAELGSLQPFPRLCSGMKQGRTDTGENQKPEGSRPHCTCYPVGTKPSVRGEEMGRRGEKGAGRGSEPLAAPAGSAALRPG